jgi:uncharacterized membrane protein YhaH (DUF805 family)
MARLSDLFKMTGKLQLASICMISAMLVTMLFSPETFANAPQLPDMSGGDTNLLNQSAGTTQRGMYYAIWLIGIILIMVPAYYLIGAFSDWMRGKKELGEVGAVIIVGVVIVVAGMWLLSTASTLTQSGITGGGA